MRPWVKRTTWVAMGVGAAALIGWSFIPRPIAVDVARIERGAMRVTVDQDGRTRVKERYEVTAPLAGMLRRIDLKAGAAVETGKTVLAVIEPNLPSLMDPRERRIAEARVRGTEAAVAQAAPRIAQAEAELGQAKVDSARARRMAEKSAASPDEVEKAELAVVARSAELQSLRSALAVARFELQQARSALLASGSSLQDGQDSAPDELPSPGESPALVEILCPCDGRVLRVLRESAGPVVAGAVLLEVADVRRLEAVIDVLSRDAAAIRPGAAVTMERWDNAGGARGGDLAGIVRTIEPSAFTKISALGVEEQRVNVIVDFVDLSQRDAQFLGDGFRVDARIVVWQDADAVKIPTGAMFRDGERWAAYLVRDRRAVLAPLTIGRMSGLEAQVIDGVLPDDAVILHPTDKIKNGVKVTPRDSAE